MSPTPPRKPRSPGQRQFNPMGTPRDWRQVAMSPEVQRALADPQIAQALYHTFRQTGGTVPPAGPPMAMQDGGPIPTPEQSNRLAQMRGGDVDPETREEIQDLSKASRYDSGGGVNESASDLDQEEREVEAEEADAARRADPQARQKAAQDRAKLNDKRSRAAQAANQPSGPVSVGSTQISGQTMQGLKKLGQQGPPTLGNMAANIGLGALMGGASGGGSGLGALIGAGTAGLLNFFIRHNAQQQKKKRAMSEEPGGGGGYDPNGSQSPGTQSPGGGGTTQASGPAPLTGAGDAPLTAPLKPGEGLAYGSANVTGGRVISRDGGKTWTNPNARPNEDAAVDPTKVTIANAADVIKPEKPPASAASVNQPQSSDPMDLSFKSQIPTLQGLAAQAGPYSDSEDTGLAQGGPVPHGGLMAHHMPVPILHTTIVIAAKPKKDSKEAKPIKKAMGGEIPQAQRRPRKPNAVPPVAGPDSSGARLPHGRVQVPRGSGAAIRGKRFGGVF